MNSPKRVVAVHDLSGYGRCSLSVIIPVLSVMGVQVCAIPTAVLSTHTGGFANIATQDLTGHVQGAINHYNEMNLVFDSVYTGYLGNSAQIAICKDYFTKNSNAIILVDPVMGDCGEAYSAITEEIQNGMSELVREADIITPNLTEACILLNEDFADGNISLDKAKDMLVRLSELGPNRVILKGLVFESGTLSNLCYNKNNNQFHSSTCKHIPANYPGTGDIFASVVLGRIMAGEELESSVDFATEFLESLINYSYEQGVEQRSGVLLESCLCLLCKGEVKL